MSEFLEFAHPAPPSCRPTGLRDLVGAAVRLARPNLAGRGLEIDFVPGGEAATVNLDGEQLQRALVNVLLDPLAPSRSGRISVSISIEAAGGTARVLVDVPGVSNAVQMAAEALDPFPEYGNGHGLSLAVARRLIENQGGTARAEARGETLRYIIDLPLEPATPAAQHVADEASRLPLLQSA